MRALLLLVLLAGCAKSKPPASDDDAPHRSAKAPRLEEPVVDDEFRPTPSEVPLTEDFAHAAQKRVTADNYRNELTTIEKELDQLAHAR